MITRAITANWPKRPINHNIVEFCSFQSMTAEKFYTQKAKQKTSARFQPQSQSISVFINPNTNNNGTTENISPTAVTGNSFPTRFVRIPCIIIPPQVPTKTIQSNSDIHNEPNTFEKFISRDNSSDVAYHQLQFQNTAILPLSQFNKTQRNIPRCNPPNDYFTQSQKKQTVTNQPNRSNDQTVMLNTMTTCVPTLLRPPLVPLNNADLNSFNTSNNKPF